MQQHKTVVYVLLKTKSVRLDSRPSSVGIAPLSRLLAIIGDMAREISYKTEFGQPIHKQNTLQSYKNSTQ
jgi:hypothetical protein